MRAKPQPSARPQAVCGGNLVHGSRYGGRRGTRAARRPQLDARGESASAALSGAVHGSKGQV
eukprot:scaffold31820_cov73-Phaeocystis_antarctica.AAC.4